MVSCFRILHGSSMLILGLEIMVSCFPNPTVSEVYPYKIVGKVWCPLVMFIGL